MGSEVVMFYKFKQKNIAHCDKQLGRVKFFMFLKKSCGARRMKLA